MARTKETHKKNEARILIFLQNADKYLKNGRRISEKLKIDYSYVMKLMNSMEKKGWIFVNIYNYNKFFELGKNAPLEESAKILIKEFKW